VQPENQTLASVTFQNYFRMYDKLAGMTGTADTEAEEFQKIYGLEVVIIPSNREIARIDHADLVYRDQTDKFNAVIEDVLKQHAKHRPVLVGTTSIDKSEYLSELLTKKGVKHAVLNAKHHEQEAEIVAQAGRYNAVTIATNMAGRGTDIVLGGSAEMMIKALPAKLSDAERAQKAEEIKAQCKREHQQVVAAGGLHIIGTERHESRRIDNQLRGRAGRQGDVGSTCFYLSLEDDLMRIFGGEKMQNMLTKMGFSEGEVIQHPWVSKAIENSQKKVEGRNFDIRKQLLEYDDVMNQQRETIYAQRRELLESETVTDFVEDMRLEVVEGLVAEYLPEHASADEWNIEGLQKRLLEFFSLQLDPQLWLDGGQVNDSEEMVTRIVRALREMMAEKELSVGSESMRHFEKYLLLQVLDHRWKEHLLLMDHLRQSIGLRGYAQKQPLQEYKRESFELFVSMLQEVRQHAMGALHSVQVDEPDAVAVEQPKEQQVQYQHEASQTVTAAKQEPEAVTTYKREHAKVGRNDPCPCGSGKKYKQCHGKR